MCHFYVFYCYQTLDANFATSVEISAKQYRWHNDNTVDNASSFFFMHVLKLKYLQIALFILYCL